MNCTFHPDRPATHKVTWTGSQTVHTKDGTEIRPYRKFECEECATRLSYPERTVEEIGATDGNDG